MPKPEPPPKFPHKLTDIPVDQVEVGERFRKVYPNIESLAKSMSRPAGLTTPITVDCATADPTKHSYRLCAGGRRMKAARRLKWPTIPAKVYDCELDEQSLREIELTENLEREDLTWAEHAESVRNLHRLFQEQRPPEEGEQSIRESAKSMGISHTQLQNELKLAAAVEVIPELKECKNKSEAHRVLRKTEEHAVAGELARRAKADDAKPKAQQNLLNSFVVADFFDEAKRLSNEWASCLEIDPPYCVHYKDRDLATGDGHKATTMAYHEVEEGDYEEFLTRLATESYRIAKKHAWAVVWYAMDPWAESVYQAFTTAGWRGSRQPLLWTKPNGPCPKPSSRLSSNYECAYYFRKGNPSLHKQGGNATFPYPPMPPAKKRHPTEKPFPLMVDMLGCFLGPKGRLLVPFAGSGVALLAGDELGASVLGYDLSQEYKDAYVVEVVKRRKQI